MSTDMAAARILFKFQPDVQDSHIDAAHPRRLVVVSRLRVPAAPSKYRAEAMWIATNGRPHSIQRSVKRPLILSVTVIVSTPNSTVLLRFSGAWRFARN